MTVTGKHLIHLGLTQGPDLGPPLVHTDAAGLIDGVRSKLAAQKQSGTPSAINPLGAGRNVSRARAEHAATR